MMKLDRVPNGEISLIACKKSHRQQSPVPHRTPSEGERARGRELR
jgi:hypothetical protein